MKSHSSSFGVHEIKTPFAIRCQGEMSTVLGTTAYLQGMFLGANPWTIHCHGTLQILPSRTLMQSPSSSMRPLGRRTITERFSEVITSLVGNMGFLLAQLILISGWILINLHAIPGLKAFDPFPFGVLALLVSSEGVFLTSC